MLSLVNYENLLRSVPHFWLVRCVSIYEIDLTITKLLKTIMNRRQTRIVSVNPIKSISEFNEVYFRKMFPCDSE